MGRWGLRLAFLGCLLSAGRSWGRQPPASLILSDSLRVYRIEPAEIRFSALSRYVRASQVSGRARAIKAFLDSRGFFDARWDTLAADTVRVTCGPRAVVDTLMVKSALPLTVDSLERLSFPRPYDAGEIARLAGAAALFCAQRGYPFATVAIAIDSARSAQLSMNGDGRRRLKVALVTEPDTRCAFDRALFTGEFRTRRELLSRDMAFKHGDTFDTRRIEESQKRLLSRDYIAEVSPGAPGTVSVEPDTIDSATHAPPGLTEYVAVPFLVRDNSGMGIDGALALQSQVEQQQGMVSGFFSLTLLNIFRSGEAASVYYRGERDLQQFDMSVAKPHLFRMPLIGSAAFGLEILTDSYGYLHGQLEFLLEFQTLWKTGIAFRGHETANRSGDVSESWRFFGADLVLVRTAERYRMGAFSKDVSVRTGTGVADRQEGRFQRWSGELSAGAHVPVYGRHAISGRLVAQTLITDDRDSLHAVERFRTGGYNSVRGYAQNEFSFKTVSFVQGEYLFYFSALGCVYIFADGGVGFVDKVDIGHDSRTDLVGYGLGVRVPVRIGTASVAWARNYKEKRGFGRIHVRIQNALSSRMGR